MIPLKKKIKTMRKDNQISTSKLINYRSKCLKLKNHRESIAVIDLNNLDSAQTNRIKITSLKVFSVKFPLPLRLKTKRTF